jgi:selenocysteine lyase/cysteine desulfurase
MEFPFDYVRGCFPTVDDPRTIFFENGSAPRILGTVRALREASTIAERPAELLAETRESLAFFLNSNDAWAEEEIVLVPDVGELARRLSVSLAKSFGPGSEVVVTELDDEWSIAPWLELLERGLSVRFWPLKRPAAGLDAGMLEELLSERTKLVVASKASSALGTIVELLPIALRIRDHESSLLVNWSPFLAHGPVDVRFLRSDFVLSSTGSFFGSRLGFLWGRRERMRKLREEAPEIFDGLEVEPRDLAALDAVLRYVEELGLLAQEMQIQPSEDYGRRRHMRRGMQAIRHYERTLTSLALRRLSRVPGATVYGIDDPDQSALRMPHLFFRLKNHEPREVASRLKEANIRVEHGPCGCPRALRSLGIPEDEGAVCASLAHYNTEAEVERFADALHDISLGG